MNPFSSRGFTALSSLFYMFLIIVTIPLAFDVGGEDCGIAFTGTLSLFYLILSTLRIMARNTKLKYLASTMYHLQHIVIPSLLILHLSLFSAASESTEAATLRPLLVPSDDPIFKLWLSLLEPWRWFVKNSTPLFTTMEGFCTLLVIQTSGRLATWLVRKRSDSWIIPQLLFSSCVFSSSLYFLYRIYTFPVTISLASATLIGAVLTVAVFLALFGIVSGRGNSVESSLLLSYIVYCLYFTFTDFQSSFSAETFLYFFSPSTRPDIPPLPPVIINGYTNLVSSVASLVPASFKTVFQFLHGAVSTVTPSVFVSLSYRLGVFWAATRIIPAIHQVSAQNLSRTQSFNTLSSLPSSSSASPPINSMKNIPPNTRLRKIRSQNSLKNSANPVALRSVSSDATPTKNINNSENDTISHTENLNETKNYILRQRFDREHSVSAHNQSTTSAISSVASSSPKLPHNSNIFSDESAIIDDSDREDDVHGNVVTAVSSSTTIVSTPDTSAGTNSKSSVNTSTYPTAQSGNKSYSNNFENEYIDTDFDDLKEKFVPYSFNDHYKLSNKKKSSSENNDNYDDDTFMNHDYEEFIDKSMDYRDDQTQNYSDDLNINVQHSALNTHSTTSQNKSSGTSFHFFILTYGPCIMIAVYTHLLIQHLAIFNTISSQYSNNTSGDDNKIGLNPRDSSSAGGASLGFEESVLSATSQTIVAFASSSIGRAAHDSLVAYGASLSSISQVGKNAIETATASIAAAASSYVESASAVLMGSSSAAMAGAENTTQEITWAATKVALIKDALLGIWQWSRSWVSTPRDSWQFWGWVNMFSTLALYAIELIYGKQGANEDIIEYHWKSD